METEMDDFSLDMKFRDKFGVLPLIGPRQSLKDFEDKIKTALATGEIPDGLRTLRRRSDSVIVD